MLNTTPLLKDYFSTQEKYGKMTILVYEVGSFYENNI